ncbi:MAG: hypothetical protein L6R30_21420 [Thermoanaerobaculia bacterium]|nr:hypothetical protein [Thermoanaerobaculia bacterium]
MTAAALLLPALLAALLSWLLAPAARRLAIAVGAVDHPGPRKIHHQPIARLGGLAVILAAAIVFLLGSSPGGVRLHEALPLGLLHALAWGLLPIFLISIWDDIRPLRALPKFGAQVLGAATTVALGVSLPDTIHLFEVPVGLGLLTAPVSVLWLVGVTNAFNIIDGLDGLSAGLALISASALTAVFLFTGQRELATATLVLVGAIVGFLPWNLYPARIFLGDTGATALGFALACFSLSGGAKLSSGFAILIPVFILGIPIADTAVAFFRRLMKRLEPGDSPSPGVFEADRNHIHHRLLALGIHHRHAVLILYGAGVLAGGIALLSVLVTAKQAAFLLAALLLAAFVGLARLGYDEFALIRKGVVLRFYDTPVLKRSFFVVFVDLLLVATAVWLSFGVKYDDWALRNHRGSALELAAILAPTTVLSFWLLGMYRGAWRLASINDFLRASTAVLASSITGGTIAFLAVENPVPVSLLAVFGLIKGAMANGLRVSYRLLESVRWRSSAAGEPVVIYGAGQGGVIALREMLSDRSLGWKPVGFIDDDPEKRGKLTQGFPVRGDVESIPGLAEAHPGLTVLIASRTISREKVRQAERLCHEAGARLLKMEISFEELVPIGDVESKPSQLGEDHAIRESKIA